MQTVTLPAQTFTGDTLKALSVTGRTVTVGGKFQAKVIAVEGTDWNTQEESDGTVTLDAQCTPLSHLADPSVRYSRLDLYTGETVHGWTTLSQVVKGVCLSR